MKQNVIHSPSGGTWFSRIPSHWAVMRLKHLARLKGGSGFPDGYQGCFDKEIRFIKVKSLSSGIDPTEKYDTISYTDAKELGATIFEQGDIVFAKVGAALLLMRFESLPFDACIDNNMMAFSNIAGSKKWFKYVVSRLDFASFVNPGAVPSVNQTQIGNIYIPVPPLSEQCTIVEYLDRETAKIDQMLEAKEKLLKILDEKRRAIITHAVTKGVNPSAKLKSSGIPWLGDIPAHWKIERTRWLFEERDERSETGEEEMLTVSHLTGVTPRSEKDVNMFEAETNEGYKRCQKSDLVINTLWAWMGAMGIAPVDGIVSPAYNVYTPGPELDPAYIDVLVRIPAFIQEVTRYSKGVWSSRLRLYPEGFYEVWLPVPSRSEQCTIVEHIKKETTRIDAMSQVTQRSIAFLKERRSVLITEAVTGKVKFG